MKPTGSGRPELDEGGPKDLPFRPMLDEMLDRPVFSIFESMALEFPSAVALRSGSAVISYGELLEKARAIASSLLSVGEPGDPVALALPVDWLYPAAMLGCLAAGRPYVPLDLRHPVERLGWILEHSGASVVLVQGAAQPSSWPKGCRAMDLEEIPDSSTGFKPVGGPASIAYIVYTSGSTGRPKGVFQDQQGLMHDVLQYTNSVHLGRGDVSSLLYSPSVNGALRDIYGVLLNGGCLCMGDLAGEGFEVVIERSIRCGITLFHAMPPVLRSLLREPGAQEMLRRVRLAYVAGDRFLVSDVRQLRAAMPDAAFLYTGIGSTECATLYRQWFVPKDWPLDQCTVLPVGRALPGRDVLICSEDGEELGTGETGVIHVRGRYLARGYWRDPQMTAQSFDGPLEPGAWRIFKTGDLGRIREDGLLEFVGRADRQVKIRGYRVDPSEPEAVLRSLPGVEEASVLVLEHQGVNRLVGCVQLVDVRALDEATILSHVAERLPSHLVPSRVLVSQQLPRLPNFKLDRIGLLHWVESAVKESHGTSVQQEGVFPVGELPSVPPMALEILREWERVLGRKLEGIHTAWRTTGGDSLQALEVLSAVERRMGRRLTTAMIHADATPASMAGELLTADPLQNEVAHATSRVPGKLWVISSLASVSVHDRRLIELLADVVDGDVLHITSIDDELQRLRSIRQLAEDCVATLIARTGLTTPVHLMGLSFGARVAFEMAGVLRERGVEVGFMGIGDIPMDARATRVENGRGGEGTLGKSVRGSGGRRLQKARDTAKSIAIDGVEWLAAHRHEWLLRWYIRWGRAVLGEGFTILSNLALRRGQAVGWNPGFFDGEVTLFVSADRGKSLIRLSPTLGWERHATSVHRVDVAGSHENYHRDEHAAGLTAEIRARLLSTHASCQVDSIPTACVRG